jgi:hypothetical protein
MARNLTLGSSGYSPSVYVRYSYTVTSIGRALETKLGAASCDCSCLCCVGCFTDSNRELARLRTSASLLVCRKNTHLGFRKFCGGLWVSKLGVAE